VHPAVGALALTAAALATRTAAGTATRRALACFGAASAIAAAARIHPLAWPVLAVAPLGALLPGAAIGRRVAGAGIVSALAAGLLAATSWAPLSAVLMSMRTMTGADGLLGGDSLTAPPFSAWLIAAMVLAVCRRIGPIPTRFALPAIAASLALAATGATFEQSPIWAAAYARLFAPFPLLLAVAAATALPRRALALAIALSVPGLWLTAPLAPETTEQAEYRALRAAFDDLPDGCVVTWLGRVDDRLLSLPVAGLPGWARGTDPDRVFDARGGSLGTGRCALWVHGSLCESAPGRPVCERVEAGTRLRLRASWELPAEPSYRGFDYLANTVPIAIYDVLGAAQ
jgi:hypothetical protein